jgi:hypothetical protein
MPGADVIDRGARFAGFECDGKEKPVEAVPEDALAHRSHIERGYADTRRAQVIEVTAAASVA